MIRDVRARLVVVHASRPRLSSRAQGCFQPLPAYPRSLPAAYQPMAAMCAVIRRGSRRADTASPNDRERRFPMAKN